MQALVRLARRTSLLQARPSFHHQGIVTRASSAQSEQGGGEIVDGADVPVPQGGESNVVREVPPFRVPGFTGVAPAAGKALPSNKIYGRLSNCPKYAFKSDILAYFEGCNLQPHQVVTIYDEKYRQRFIQLEFDNLEGFRQAQRAIVRQGRLGGRYLKLDMESKRADEDDIHNIVKAFRGQSLLLMQVPNEATVEDVERFFQGYNLAAYSTKFLRVQKDFPTAYSARKVLSNSNPSSNFEMRALVKFSSPLEASRALRAKHGQFCLNKSIDLRFVQ